MSTRVASPDLEARLRRVRLLLFDVDGVLTDGSLSVDDSGVAAKRFSIIDGAGIKMAQASRLMVGFLSGHDSRAAVHRANSLGVTLCHVGVRDKLDVLTKILAETGLSSEEVLFMGDDLVDLPVLRAVGLATSVPDAHPAVLDVAHWVSSKRGGAGAAREVIELVLVAQGSMARFLGTA